MEAFELLAEVSPKNSYRFGISMEFADRAAYDGYNEHPDHVRFVQARWLAEVSDFLELYYAAVETGRGTSRPLARLCVRPRPRCG